MFSQALKNRKQVEEYVERELSEGTPQGWKWNRPDREKLWWTIEKLSIPPGEWHNQEYSLHVSEDLCWFIMTYENNDIGCGSLSQTFQKARTISVSSLEYYPLRSCLEFIVENCKPNEWGYT